MSSGFAVRRMKRGEVDLIREWANVEGWNPGLHDGGCFFDTDPEGFFLGELDGQPVACISCVAYDNTFGFLGQYIAKPEFRGKGYGLQTWQAGMAHLGNRNIGLDGVLNQQSNYERSGFVFANQDIRFQGEGGGVMPGGLVPIARVPFDEVLAYDRRCFPVPRPAFLRGWLALPESISLGCLCESRLAGFGVARRSVNGFKIGPLFADDLTAADTLLRGLVAEIGANPFCLDIPDATANRDAGELVRRFGMTEQFRTARMYTRGRPALDMQRVFGITTMELG